MHTGQINTKEIIQKFNWEHIQNKQNVLNIKYCQNHGTTGLRAVFSQKTIFTHNSLTKGAMIMILFLNCRVYNCLKKVCRARNCRTFSFKMAKQNGVFPIDTRVNFKQPPF